MGLILYIGGIGHNGSTILDIMLSESENVLSMGQVGALHEYLDNGQCACGENLTKCPLWGRVLAHLDEAKKNQSRELGPLISSEKNFIRFIASSAFCRLYADAQDMLLDSVFRMSGSDVLIDSSKNLSRAVALLRASKYDIRFLHLVRDGRGFVNSFNKRQQETGKRLKFLHPMVQWCIKNSVSSTIIRTIANGRYLCISLEELMLRPQNTIEQIGKFVNYDFSVTVSHIKSKEAFLKKHIFSGNRISRKNSLVFDPSLIKTNKLKGMSNDKFWYFGGWISAFWSYKRKQSYLSTD